MRHLELSNDGIKEAVQVAQGINQLIQVARRSHALPAQGEWGISEAIIVGDLPATRSYCTYLNILQVQQHRERLLLALGLEQVVGDKA